MHDSVAQPRARAAVLHDVTDAAVARPLSVPTGAWLGAVAFGIAFVLDWVFVDPTDHMPMPAWAALMFHYFGANSVTGVFRIAGIVWLWVGASELGTEGRPRLGAAFGLATGSFSGWLAYVAWDEDRWFQAVLFGLLAVPALLAPTTIVRGRVERPAPDVT